MMQTKQAPNQKQYSEIEDSHSIVDNADNDFNEIKQNTAENISDLLEIINVVEQQLDHIHQLKGIRNTLNTRSKSSQDIIANLKHEQQQLAEVAVQQEQCITQLEEMVKYANQESNSNLQQNVIRRMQLYNQKSQQLMNNILKMPQGASVSNQAISLVNYMQKLAELDGLFEQKPRAKRL